MLLMINQLMINLKEEEDSLFRIKMEKMLVSQVHYEQL